MKINNYLNRITILYDNTSISPKLISDWGFSCLIETEDRNILFDTGGNGKILLENMSLLEIDPKRIDDIFISHQHFDHIGGLSAIMNENSKAVVHIPRSLKGIKYPNKVISYDNYQVLYENIYSTGELNGDEQSLVIKTDRGSVVIIGCCHPGLKNILSSLKEKNIYAVIGGLHGSTEFDQLKNVTKVCPTHCTKHIEEIKKLYPDKYISGGAGAIIEF